MSKESQAARCSVSVLKTVGGSDMVILVDLVFVDIFKSVYEILIRYIILLTFLSCNIGVVL